MKKFILIISLALAAHVSLAQDYVFKLSKNLEIFHNLVRTLDYVYVDTLDSDRAFKRGINAMLYSLDPYTIYYPEEETKDLRQMVTGKYAGIGALIKQHYRDSCCVINQPYFGMPAQEVGLRKGDRIIAIDDSCMLGKTTDYVSSHLRGDAGSTFTLRFFRPSLGKELTTTITRRNIHLPAVSYSGMLDSILCPGYDSASNIGYILLTSFTEDCSKEFRNAFLALKEQGMQRLIIDLRENGGGSLAECLMMLNMFLPRDTRVLSTKGKLASAQADYTMQLEPLDTIMPIVVMVDENSASASEIFAGALQDLHRATLIGRKTFGKGLVQSSFDLPHNAQAKITTSRYYLPSDRCIQGTGVEPDIVLAADTITNLAGYLLNVRDSAENVFTYVCDYIDRHPTIASPKEFALSDADYDEFKALVISNNFTYDKQTEKHLKQLKDLAQFEGYYNDAKAEFDALEQKLVHNLEHDLEINRELMKQLLGREIVRNYYYDEGEVEFTLRWDSQLRQAAEALASETVHDEACPEPSAPHPAEPLS